MAVERIGSVGAIEDTNASNSQSITVPTDATLVIVGVSAGFYNATDEIDGGAANDASTSIVQLDGTDFKIGAVYDDNTSHMSAGLLYQVNPSTGVQTLAWDWGGNNAPDDGAVIYYAFYKGVDTSSLVKDRATDTANTGTSVTTGSLTAASGDMIVCCCCVWSSNAIGWTNATEISEDDYNGQTGAYAEESPSAATTVTASGNSSYYSLAGIVLTASAAGGASIVPLVANYFRRIRG